MPRERELGRWCKTSPQMLSDPKNRGAPSLGRPALSPFFATTNNSAPPACLVVDSAKSARGSFVRSFNQQLCAEDPRLVAEGACLQL